MKTINGLKKEIKSDVKRKSRKMKRLFDNADASDYSKLAWRIFMSYLGTEDCKNLSLQDRALVIDLYTTIDGYLMQKWNEQDMKREKAG